MTKAAAIPMPEVVKPVFQHIRLSEIKVPQNRARELDADWAQALAFMIAAQGLINPITVRMIEGCPHLVTGLHRHAAFAILEWETIPARVSNAATDDDARLEEVMENLGRHELKVLDRCHHLFELKQVYERLHPQTKAGTAGALAKHGSANEIFSFAQDTAEKVGLSRRSIEIAVKIWKDLAVSSRQRCVGTWLSDHQAGLKQLSEQSHTDQAKVLEILFGETPQATNVPDALTILANGRVKTHLEKRIEKTANTLNSLPGSVANAIVASDADARLAEMQKSIATLSKFFGKLEDDELDKVVADHEDRIVASLQRRGRI
ncbi:chromosome partitioning protein ParB [Brucella anthropi]|uniref:Chromosome partitioning protein ParB n=1 Tax=Brucella anthropi TaxID=529 RepID=A0A6I0E062_BRUAN|nr:ParB/RepB/Spo0J family partition protein [Brucella anthropi]KAB2803274.1 chromosome partitioning protein ParB [Brucella anthropi]